MQLQDQFYILASSLPEDERRRVLKHNDSFAVFDTYGDLPTEGLGQHGLYHEGTRFLSYLLFTLFNRRPILLSSTIADNSLLVVEATNPDINLDDDILLPRGSIYVQRAKFVWEGSSYERITLRNYGLFAVETPFALAFAADFADIFQVRGTHRARHGQQLTPEVGDRYVIFTYEGLDGVTRRTTITCSDEPDSIEPSSAGYSVMLAPHQEYSMTVSVACTRNEPQGNISVFDDALAQAQRELAEARAADCQVDTSNAMFNDWVKRSAEDLHMMISDTPVGPYPYAGVPWYDTPFGRDGIITAMETLWINPELARGVLAFLAATQAKEISPAMDAEPGKILHETRKGEMAALGEVPFGLYYGSVDATPLFVMLAGAYYERTGDREFLESIWRNVERALEWIDVYGDKDGDGFVEYYPHPEGLVHQGWKDSYDAIFHADGSPAEGAIALCEVQGYVYAAKQAAAKLATVLGKKHKSRSLLEEAEQLKRRFNEVFWCDEIENYALALDGRKKLCLVRASNGGHCLFSGIATAERARIVAHTLTGPDFFSGWGIRTVAAGEIRYNPMSYHNGSVWPHDNAMIASGLARYGFKQHALRILGGLFDASVHLDLNRLPELFCGFPRAARQGPTMYPVSCSPQAWAAASVFYLLQACLGLSIDAVQKQVCFSYPVLPESLNTVYLRGLRVGDATLDIAIVRYPDDVGINVLRRQGEAQVLNVK